MRFPGRLHPVLFSLWITAVLAKKPSGYSDLACNNSPDLCERQYDDITHLGAHNSAFVRDSSTGYSLAANQYFDAPTALDGGVRLLQAQVQELNEGDGKPVLCHTSCTLLNAGPLNNWLKPIKKWMDDHPSEVVTILIVNGPNFPATTIKAAFDDAGLSDMLFEPEFRDASSTWPTLGEMIDSKKRLVLFLNQGAGVSPAPGILDEFTYIFETPFTVTEPTGFNCTVDRPKNIGGNPGDRIPFLNHFLYDDLGAFGILLPNESYIATTNGGKGTGNLDGSANGCANEWQRQPGFVLVDFFDQGPAIETVDKLNRIKKPVNRVNPPSPPHPNSRYQGPKGRAGLQRLAIMQANGGTVKPGQWIMAAGVWSGETAGLGFDLSNPLGGAGSAAGSSSSSSSGSTSDSSQDSSS